MKRKRGSVLHLEKLAYRTVSGLASPAGVLDLGRETWNPEP
jgi:hypothetical protein